MINLRDYIDVRQAVRGLGCFGILAVYFGGMIYTLICLWW